MALGGHPAFNDFDQSNALLPRLELHRLCAGANGLCGFPAIRWSAVMSALDSNGNLQM